MSKMAMSLRVLGGCLSGKTPSLAHSFAVKGLPVPPVAVRANFPSSTARTLTLAAASKPAVAAETKKREPRGITKPRRVSPEMHAFLGVPEIPRTQALKEIWAYIKKHNLQDPQDKKVIICDEKLKTIFAGKDRVGFLEIAGLMNPHFLK
ncbi:OLC1v1002963C1 [Oldenlandia corymbosa var. corymbosa]|uniref:OLC1v1002963C1 n=1 Tax=Oldenlandia corymbosa var. corymbosa TaxID=529605 RepID=A0AAV1DBC7_OLDCO|nr:OLC1v1002963C1 [Oldenlandia corymbosa var. corymbosa]